MTGGSTATRRSRATATGAARSSASCTSRPRCRADRGRPRAHARGRRVPRRADRDLVAVRLLDDRDDRARRAHRRALDHAGGLSHVHARRARRRRRHVRRPWRARRGGPRRRRPARLRARRGARPGRRARRAAGHGDHAPGPPPAPRALAAGDADAGRRGLYGVLLGLGFTTFVLTFGVFALAGIVVAVGEPPVGVAVGLAFAVGRALPITLVAPIADRPAGIRVTEAMAGRPAIYRGFPRRRRARPPGRRRGARRHRPRDGVEGRGAVRRRPGTRRRRAGLRASRRVGLPAARRRRDGAPGARPGCRPGKGRRDPERRDPRPLGHRAST